MWNLISTVQHFPKCSERLTRSSLTINPGKTLLSYMTNSACWLWVLGPSCGRLTRRKLFYLDCSRKTIRFRANSWCFLLQRWLEFCLPDMAATFAGTRLRQALPSASLHPVHPFQSKEYSLQSLCCYISSTSSSQSSMCAAFCLHRLRNHFISTFRSSSSLHVWKNNPFTQALGLTDVIVAKVISGRRKWAFLPALECKESNLNTIIVS